MTNVITIESLGLPTKRSTISELFRDQKFLMYGSTKIGKTRFFAQCDGAFFIKTEQGHNHVEVIGVSCNSYDEVMAVLGKLIQARNITPYPYSIIVIDTFDRYIEFVDDSVIQWGREKFKNVEINSIGDVPNGAGWSERTSRISAILRRLDEIPCAKAIIMHATIDELEDERGKYKKETVNIGGKSNKVITGWADHTMAVKSIFVGDQLIRKVKLRPTRNLDAGSRGILPEELPWVGDDKKNFETFRAYFK